MALAGASKLGRLRGLLELHPWRNWIAHRSSEPRVTGSNPVGCIALRSTELSQSPQIVRLGVRDRGAFGKLGIQEGAFLISTPWKDRMVCEGSTSSMHARFLGLVPDSPGMHLFFSDKHGYCFVSFASMRAELLKPGDEVTWPGTSWGLKDMTDLATGETFRVCIESVGLSRAAVQKQMARWEQAKRDPMRQLFPF